MTTKFRRSLLVAAATALLSAGLLGSAQAQVTRPASAPMQCTESTGVKACFDTTSNDVWVKDTKADGHHVQAWVSWNSSGAYSSAIPNTSRCKNTSGYGRWKRCDGRHVFVTGKTPYLNGYRYEGSQYVSGTSRVIQRP